ncbi:MAG: DJ-1/PfpI family protein [Bacteroidota bacterium]
MTSDAKTPSLSTQKRTVGIVIFNEVEVLDFAGPFEVFSVASELHNHEFFEVKLVAKTKDPVTAVNGLSVNPYYSFEDAPDFDILIIPGGFGARAVLKDDASLKWIQQRVKVSELTMSVCTGSAILAKLGLLDGKPYCTHHSVYSFVKTLTPTGKPQEEKRFTQSDKKLYTSAGISAGIDLSFHIVEKLHGEKVAKETARYMEY